MDGGKDIDRAETGKTEGGMMEAIFKHAKHEVFEDGYDSVFSRDIEEDRKSVV